MNDGERAQHLSPKARKVVAGIWSKHANTENANVEAARELFEWLFPDDVRRAVVEARGTVGLEIATKALSHGCSRLVNYQNDRVRQIIEESSPAAAENQLKAEGLVAQKRHVPAPQMSGSTAKGYAAKIELSGFFGYQLNGMALGAMTADEVSAESERRGALADKNQRMREWLAEIATKARDKAKRLGLDAKHATIAQILTDNEIRVCAKRHQIGREAA